MFAVFIESTNLDFLDTPRARLRLFNRSSLKELIYKLLGWRGKGPDRLKNPLISLY